VTCPETANETETQLSTMLWVLSAFVVLKIFDVVLDAAYKSSEALGWLLLIPYLMAMFAIVAWADYREGGPTRKILTRTHNALRPIWRRE